MNKPPVDSYEPLSPLLLEGRFSGPVAFSELVRQALAAAATQGWREIILSDPDFHDWPLGERAVIQALNLWARSGRKCTMLASNYDAMHRQHPRFVTWRQTWSHLVECRLAGNRLAREVPSAIWSPMWVFNRFDLGRMWGVAGSEVARRVALRERLAELLLKSSPGFPATTLGL